VLERATPVTAQLASFSSALQPVSGIVSKSADNLVAILQNWSRAIQFRDSLSHVFRGEATFTPQTITSMINQLQQAGLLGSSARRKARRGHQAATSSPATRVSGKRPAAASGQPAATGAPATTAPTAAGSTPSSGTTTTAGTAPTTTTPAPSGSGPGSGGTLGSLLNYLLGP
jgi:hypothetical protein